MWNAGLRVFDLRDPDKPTEVAYFNPGIFGVPLLDGSGAPLDPALNLQGQRGFDQAWGHVRYVPETGQIWVATRTGGFWVLELEPRVREFLGLRAVPTRSPNGAPPRTASSRSTSPALEPSSPTFYCTLGRL